MREATFTGLVWFRGECTKLENNPALQAAAKTGGKFFCCYVGADEQSKSKNRTTRNKILSKKNLETIDKQLRSEYNTSLIIVKKGSLILERLRQIAYILGVQYIYFNRKSERSGLQLQSTLSSLTGLCVQSFDSEVKKLSFSPVESLKNVWKRLTKSPKNYNVTCDDSTNKRLVPVGHPKSLDVSRIAQALRNHERSKPILIPARRKIHQIVAY